VVIHQPNKTSIMQSIHQRMQEMKQSYKTELSERGLQNDLPDGESPHGVREAVDCIHGHLYDHRLTVRWMRERCRLNGHNFAGQRNRQKCLKAYLCNSLKQKTDFSAAQNDEMRERTRQSNRINENR
jgi:hypothetical protein